MTDNQKPYDVLSVEEYTDSNGEVKTRFHRVGVAFDNQDGDGQTLIIPNGLAISGKVHTKTRKGKGGNDA